MAMSNLPHFKLREFSQDTKHGGINKKEACPTEVSVLFRRKSFRKNLKNVLFLTFHTLLLIHRSLRIKALPFSIICVFTDPS